jgi:inosose dehydratase
MSTGEVTSSSASRGTRGRAIPRAKIGIVHILWANDDLPELTPPIEPLAILDEISRLGYEGTQLAGSFPRGAALEEALAARGLRIAEVYACIECAEDGPLPGALEVGRAKLAELHAVHGDTLVAALPVGPARIPWGGRAEGPEVPAMTEEGFRRLAELLETLGREAADLGHLLAFHNHVGTYVETPGEVDRLFSMCDPALVGSCLDVGHYILGGGDPVAALARYGDRVRHVHLKDVDGAVKAGMQTGEVDGFLAGLRTRVFTEVGRGLLDVRGILETLDGMDYAGWVMVEQDTTWRPPSESAAMSRAVVDHLLREIAATRG